MKRVLLSLALSLISIPALQVLQATREVGYQGKPVAVTQLGPQRSGPRSSFGNSIIKDQFRVVVRDRDTWLEVWKRIYQVVPSNGPYPEVPEIDFSREMVVVAAMGQRPTSGYDIIVDSAYQRDDRLEVVVKSVMYWKCYGVFMMVTSPIDIVRLPKIERPVVFREIEVAPDCKLLRG